PNARLRHVLISDERDSTQHNTIFAREGAMVSNPATQAVTLRLRDGFIHTTDGRAGTEYQTHFQFYDVNLDLRQMIEGARQRERDPKELTLAQLGRAIVAKRAAELPFIPELVEYHRKFSIPFACIVFALVAGPRRERGPASPPPRRRRPSRARVPGAVRAQPGRVRRDLHHGRVLRPPGQLPAPRRRQRGDRALLRLQAAAGGDAGDTLRRAGRRPGRPGAPGAPERVRGAPGLRRQRLADRDAASATWDGTRWQLSGARTLEFTADGTRQRQAAPPGFTIPETLEDFRAVSVEPEELSYGMLRRQIKDLRRKGVDTHESLVDLHLKL